MALLSFNAYHSYLETMTELSDAECGRLFRACLIYSKTGTTQELRGNEKILFPAFKVQIDRDKEAYEATCEKNRTNILRRYTVEYDGIRSSTKSTKDKDKDKDKDKREKERAPEGARKKPPVFHPPTAEEVAAYCLERGNGVDALKFHDFYASKGWMVGKNPMKDWRAAVRTWERSGEKRSGPSCRGGNIFLDLLMEGRDDAGGSDGDPVGVEGRLPGPLPGAE